MLKKLPDINIYYAFIPFSLLFPYLHCLFLTF